MPQAAWRIEELDLDDAREVTGTPQRHLQPRLTAGHQRLIRIVERLAHGARRSGSRARLDAREDRFHERLSDEPGVDGDEILPQLAHRAGAGARQVTGCLHETDIPRIVCVRYIECLVA